MKNRYPNRREFLFSVGNISASAWIASTWPQIVAAAEHAEHIAATAPERFRFLNPADAADVDAMAAQILPSGETPGAREAHAVYFIDRALTTFFYDRAAVFRSGLTGLKRKFRLTHPTVSSFAAAPAADQIAFLRLVERTDFFEMLRFLTILGTFSASQYGGNYAGTGWKLIGFEDRHVFNPPFGYYDRDYPGFALPAEEDQS